MIYQAILKIRGKEIPILYYSYRCHIQHCDDPNLRRIIQLHIEACEKTGNREYLPVEGDLITLMFECNGDEQFFYDWLNEGALHNGEIHFIYNEVEIADIFQFWDCFCLKIEEGMSTGSSSMVMTIYLSPGIIKRNNLDPREKVWKVSDVLQQSSVLIASESNVENKAEIVEVYWMDAEAAIRIEKLPENGIVTLCAKVKNANAGEIVTFEIEYDDGIILQKTGFVDINNNVIIKGLKLNREDD
ncbi:hypothetical protein J8852_02895 [Bacteroides uniformis]|uniref:type VI secretion system tube protein TssD n=1 Tax=Bacteroides uniformis TaxID=820 RepID=UPI001F47C520|nr:type VI secretion system tube protein TssD [Bacteroides uniformis]MCE8473405.1 hypothetical protein [Bacteroides uniformis]